MDSLLKTAPHIMARTHFIGLDGEYDEALGGDRVNALQLHCVNIRETADTTVRSGIAANPDGAEFRGDRGGQFQVP
jgi:hypothetical protein